MPSQTVEMPQMRVADESAPSITTDAQYERAWVPPYLAPGGAAK
ncbi:MULTISPECIES: hypothetical protein [Streptomyces]|uniref:Uncharacterized protein n=1 Tax=Streptomyces nymphaeiformis TaxID=2663842 RepID=A0A7W7XB00_9ACTN|nr:hypothetical protein [Streptomyces nymphaeiformis]MBB4980896.1 hypothetical protein [Streptomyces nymphaeiformis]